MVKKNALSKKDIKFFNNEFEKFKFEVNKKDLIFKIIDEKNNIFLEKNNEIIFHIINEKLIPSLKIAKDINIKKVYIDKNAVKFIYAGADLMRPGITKIDEDINTDEIVLIALESPYIPIEYGLSMFDSKTIEEKDSGKVIKNLKIRKIENKE